MKKKVSILIVLFCCLNLSCLAQQKSKKELKAEQEAKKEKEIDSLITSKSFAFEAQKVTPQGGGRFRYLDNNTYFLRFDLTKTTCDLPFFGRAYNLPYGGGDGGIKFEGTPENVVIEKKKNNYRVKATVKGKDDVYDLTLTVFFDGGATLFVTSNNRASISYDGVIERPLKVISYKE